MGVVCKWIGMAMVTSVTIAAADRPGVGAVARSLRGDVAVLAREQRRAVWDVREMITAIRDQERFVLAPKKEESEDVRSEVRDAVIAEGRGVVVQVRRELGESLEEARKQCCEQARKLAEETKDFVRAKSRRLDL